MLATRIRKLREAKGMSQSDLAGKVGVTQAYIASLESGARKNPSLDIIRKLAKVLKTDVANLLN
jgi:XRE family transcriptional regulator of biofilm formation